MTIETIIEWIQTNSVRSELIAIQASGIITLGYMVYQNWKDEKSISNTQILEPPYKPKPLPKDYCI